MKVLKACLVMLFSVCLLSGCTTQKQEATAVETPSNVQPYVCTAFLTTQGYGLASQPFGYDAQMNVEWRTIPEWTALPIYVYGNYDEATNTISDAYAGIYDYQYGKSKKADLYFAVIQGGYQERFEDTFIEVYNKLNGEEEDGEIDPTPIEEFLSMVYGDENFGTLRDALTDALMVVKEYNEGGDEAELNTQAYEAYNKVYQWLFSFSVNDLEE